MYTRYLAKFQNSFTQMLSRTMWQTPGAAIQTGHEARANEKS